MGYHKNNYLDQSLDDTIKNNRRRPPYEKRRPVPRANEPRRPDSKSRASINSRVGKVVIPPKRPIKERNTDLVINRRPKPNNHNSSSLDPSQIVITKTIKRDPQQKKQQAANLVINRNKRPTQEPARETPPPPPPPQPQPPVEKSRIVLLCNLDPRATAKDIGDTCAMFGPITSCDLLVDPMGRPLYEAEIEFVYPDSAEQCVAKLDNKFADGRMLRARLQKSATLPVKPRYSSRHVIASARVAPGGFNNSNTPMVPPQYVQQQPARQPPPQQQPQAYPYYPQYQQQPFYNKRY